MQTSNETRTGTNRTAFIGAMGAAANGVNLVTTDGPGGKLGLTVSAVSSVSADPPLLLACIHRRSPVCAAISANGVFCVNVLSVTQRDLADVFAGRPVEGRPYDFSRANWVRGTTAAPALVGAVSGFDCVVEHRHDAGSHTIFLGAVIAARTSNAEPLLYSRREYGQVAPVDTIPGVL